MNRMRGADRKVSSLLQPKRLFSLAALLLVFGLAECPAQSWVRTSAPTENTNSPLGKIHWMPPACSADGGIIFAADALGLIYASKNAGSTWATTGAPSTNWNSIACSADGARVAAINGSEIATLFLSTNFGAAWTQFALPTGRVRTVAMSAEGSRIFISQTYEGWLLTSSDFGATWTNHAAPDFMIWMESSADGTRLVMQAQGPKSPIYVSTNSGIAWTATEAYNDYPEGVGISADGVRMIVATATPYVGGPLFVSQDTGATWETADLPWDFWTSVCSSADGRTLAAAGLHTYVSTDFGRTWSLTDLYTGWVTYLASSADGCRLIAAAQTKGIYIWETVPRPALSITRGASTVHLSWLVPSRPFVLQQSPTLAGEWTNILVQPTLNYTNLNHEVTIPAPPGQMFYRLVAED